MFAHPEDHVSQNMKSISDTYEVQVLIAYFLDKIERPCTPAQLLEIATSDGVVNYFVYSEVIEKMLENVANYYEEDVQLATEQMMTILEPAIIVVMAVVVGFLVIAMLSPMFSLYESLSNPH